MDKKIYEHREFLNDRTYMLGAIGAEVYEPMGTKNDDGTMRNHWYSESASLTIGDCSRQVQLSFSADTEEEYRESLQKFRRLLKTIGDMEATFKAQLPALKKGWAHQKALNKKHQEEEDRRQEEEANNE